MQNKIKKILEQLYRQLEDEGDLGDKELYKYIDNAILDYSRAEPLSLSTREKIRVEVYNSMKKLDILQELVDDDSITEIMINGYENIFIEKQGKIVKWNKQFIDNEKLQDIAQKIAANSNRIVNESTPIVDTRLENGSRVNIVLPPVAINGPIITIRKFYESPITIDKLIEYNSISSEAAAFLEKAVKAKYNIFVSGGTGSGKTTFLNALSNFIPEDERVITIEDSAELQLRKVKNLVRLEARNANIEGTNAITIRDLIKSSLRMRPDRIIVGEVRGPEAIDMIQGMSTGHDGSMSTGHSNSPKDMLNRLETMILMGLDMPLMAIKTQVASAIDIIIHLGRLRDKTRRVLSIVEVLDIQEGVIQLNPLYEFKEYGEDENKRIIGELKRSENNFINTYKMESAGINS